MSRRRKAREWQLTFGWASAWTAALSLILLAVAWVDASSASPPTGGRPAAEPFVVTVERPVPAIVPTSHMRAVTVVRTQVVRRPVTRVTTRVVTEHVTQPQTVVVEVTDTVTQVARPLGGVVAGIPAIRRR